MIFPAPFPPARGHGAEARGGTVRERSPVSRRIQTGGNWRRQRLTANSGGNYKRQRSEKTAGGQQATSDEHSETKICRKRPAKINNHMTNDWCKRQRNKPTSTNNTNRGTTKTRQRNTRPTSEKEKRKNQMKKTI